MPGSTHPVASSDPIALARLGDLMSVTAGRPEVRIGLLDGSVDLSHPDLATEHIVSLVAGPASPPHGPAAAHGTFVAGILSARRSSAAPALAPDCTLISYPVFGEPTTISVSEVLHALSECISAGARIINLSAVLGHAHLGSRDDLAEALRCIGRHGVLLVAAAGNSLCVAGSALTQHPSVIPVVGYAGPGRPLPGSTLGRSIGARGVGGPGASIVSLGLNRRPVVSSGTSVAAPFVTGLAALLWSAVPDATPADLKSAILATGPARRRSIVPPLIDGHRAYLYLRTKNRRRGLRHARN